MNCQRMDNGIRCVIAGDDSYTLDLIWYGADILRVRAWTGRAAPSRPSLVVTAEPAGETWGVAPHGDGVAVHGASLSAAVTAAGRIAFERDGVRLLSADARAFPPNDLPDPDDQRGAEQTFRLNAGEALYGLGQYQNGVMNWRGHDATLIHGNVTVAVPFLVSTGGWGVLWDNTSHTTFHDGDDGMRLWSEVADAVDYYVCAGDSMDAVIAGYRALTGAAPLFPRAFYGFIQCKERYCTADELTGIVQESRRRQLPLDVIVQDWRYWGEPSQWSGMHHDPTTFGDLPGAIQAIHALHAEVMISIWPAIGPGTALAKELEAGGHLFAHVHWSGGRIYDAFAEEARAIYWRHAREGLFDLGIDAWWMDGTEPEFADCHDPALHKVALLAQEGTAAGSWARVLNAFSLVTTRGVYEGQRATTSDKRVFILTRSGFAGQQRYGAAVWSGDISASWAVFAKQIPAGLNFCLSGLPYWTTDNGAFFVRGRGATFSRGIVDPAFREFFLRWFQYSCFCPLMRSHGTQTPREIWQFGEPGETIYEALAAFDRLRMRLLPYTYSLAGACTRRGGTLMRALAMDFPRDAAVHAIADQFMFGPAFMACPVAEPMVHRPTDSLQPILGGEMRTGDRKGSTMRTFDGLDSMAEVACANHPWGIDFSWTGSNPAGVTSDAYRVEFDTMLHLEAEGPATALVRVAGRVKIQLDGVCVVDDWRDAESRDLRFSVPRGADRDVALRVIYGHASGDAVLQLGWDVPIDLPERDPNAPPVRDVYLPEGTWFDFWTGRPHVGGRSVSVPAPLETMPLLVRAGAIVPLGAPKQWHDEMPDDVLEIRVYPGANGTFTLYEDEGDGYAYEEGAFSEIDLAWDDGARTLTISDRRGGFPGMLTIRQFHLVVVREGHGCGGDVTRAVDQTIAYDGHAVGAP